MRHLEMSERRKKIQTRDGLHQNSESKQNVLLTVGKRQG